jgi:hypothetical protein
VVKPANARAAITTTGIVASDVVGPIGVQLARASATSGRDRSCDSAARVTCETVSVMIFSYADAGRLATVVRVVAPAPRRECLAVEGESGEQRAEPGIVVCPLARDDTRECGTDEWRSEHRVQQDAGRTQRGGRAGSRHDKQLTPTTATSTGMRDVVKLVRRVAHDLGRNPIAAGRLRLQLTEMDAAVDVGETDLDRLIANLVDNALKYSPGGEPIDVVVESDIAGVVVRDPIMASDSGQP